MANARDDLMVHAAHGEGPGVGIPLIVLAIVTLGALFHPHPLVLGVLSAILVAAGFVMTFVVLAKSGWRLQSAGDRMLVPGLLLFFGFMSAALCDADKAAQALSHLRI